MSIQSPLQQNQLKKTERDTENRQRNSHNTNTRGSIQSGLSNHALMHILQSMRGGGLTEEKLADSYARARVSTGRRVEVSDFEQLGARLHRGSDAIEATRAVGARAVTVGTDVYLGETRTSSGTADRQHLLAHELAHVRQQQESGAVHACAAVMTLEEIDSTLNQFARDIANPAATLEQKENYEATRARLQRLRQQIVAGGEVDWSLTVSGPYGIHTSDGPSPRELADFYRRCSAFSSGIESLSLYTRQIEGKIIQEQSDWYVFSDRTYTRPVVKKIHRTAEGFAKRAMAYLNQSRHLDPDFASQLDSDLVRFGSRLDRFAASAPSEIGSLEGGGRRFVGGVMGAGGAFLGFLRLGLWDSWGQLVFDGSEERIQQAQEGMMNFMSDTSEQGFGTAVGDRLESGVKDLEHAYQMGYHTEAGSRFGAAAFDAYFLGRGLVSGVQGGVQITRAARLYKAAGAARPWLTATGTALREMATFRGVGVHRGGGLWGSQYRVATSGPTVEIQRVINTENDLIAKHFRGAGEGGSQQVIGGSGEQPTLDAVAQQHASSSSGSPMQSGFPHADIESYILANPQNFGVVSQGGTVVTIRVPARTLIDANALKSGQAVSAAERNLLGVRAPESLRPETIEAYRTAGYGPEVEAWTQRTLGVEGTTARALEGMPVYEWEQIMAAGDLRPYVVRSTTNPFAGEGSAAYSPLRQRGIFGLPRRTPIYDPAVNPRTSYGLARGSPEGIQNFQAYSRWLRGGAGEELGLSPSQIAGYERMTMLGGGPISLPFVAAPVPEPQIGIPSDSDIRNYSQWLADETGTPSLSPPQAGHSGQRGIHAPSTVGTGIGAGQMAMVAARTRGLGGKIEELRVDPTHAVLRVKVDSDPDRIEGILRAAVAEWSTTEMLGAIQITVETENAEQESSVTSMRLDVPLPSNLRVQITTKRRGT